jgi:hypothetical protein
MACYLRNGIGCKQNKEKARNMFNAAFQAGQVEGREVIEEARTVCDRHFLTHVSCSAPS